MEAKVFNFKSLREGASALAVASLIACGEEDPIAPTQTDPNVVDIAVANGFNTLVTALDAADLVQTLQGPGPFTVFAPTDDAFAALPAGVLDALLADADLLTEVLLYHVVSGDVRAADVVGLSSATTINGAGIAIGVNGSDIVLSGVAPLNDANVVQTDVLGTNGVVHIIDKVLLPEILFDIAQQAEDAGFGTLLAALEAADLTDVLKGTGPFTVFAPTDEAFAALGYTLEVLLANPSLLGDVLQYHVVPGAVDAATVVGLSSATTLETSDVTITVNGSDVVINDANVILTDVETTNGIIHVIDAVLVPGLNIVETAIITEETSTLVTAVTEGDLAGTLSGTGPFTVFAPINAAFEALGTDKLDVLLDDANLALLQKVLTYHVLPGDIRAGTLTDGLTVATVEGSDVTFDLSSPSSPKINGIDIIATDIVTENGVIHLIDGVLTESLNLVDVAILNGFETLVSLVAQQGLAGALSDPNATLTVFAPTDEAFAALSAVPSGQALTDVLTYHVLDAIALSTDLSDGLTVTNQLLAGASFTVNISGSDVTITDGAGNTMNVVLTDVPASNGVIHVIDGVILPTP